MPTRFIGVTGLPRAGSTLLCQLLAMHPQLYSEGVSSPLCNVVLQLRRLISDDTFFLSQLDQSFDRSYGHLKSGLQGLLRGWYVDCGDKIVVDKNRAWLLAVETLLHIEPDARLIVCLRDLGQIYGSIEAQHQRTILVDFIDKLADLDRFGRADQLFARDKVIGAPLLALQAVSDLPPAVKDRLYFLRFEDLMRRPRECMAHLTAWLGVDPLAFDPAQLETTVPESDSHHRMKYRHSQGTSVRPPQRHELPPRIQTQIQTACDWYYRLYYPELLGV